MGSVSRSIRRNRMIRPYTDGDQAAKVDRTRRAKIRDQAEAEVSAEVGEARNISGHKRHDASRPNKRAQIKARYKKLCTAAGLSL